MKKDRKLTLKQRSWLKEYLKTKNATEAAMRVYDCKDRDSAKVIGWENLTKLNFSEALEEAGVTDALLISKLNEGLDAKKVISARITGKDADSQTDDFIDVEDYSVRHKYLETALKLKKRLEDKSPELPDININLIADTLQAIILSDGNLKDRGKERVGDKRDSQELLQNEKG